MNRQDIIDMIAKVYGVAWANEAQLKDLEKFAALVASAERKECEKIIWNADDWIGSDAKIWIVKSIQESRGQE